MNKMKRFAAITAAVLMMGTMSVSALAAYSSPAEAAAGVTGKSEQEILDLLASGQSYGQIALDAGKLEEYQEAVAEMQKERMDALVEADRIDRAAADQFLADMASRQQICNGTGMGYGYGYGCGMGGGRGMGRGMGRGACLYY